VILERFTRAIEAYYGGFIRSAKEKILEISESAQSLPSENAEADDGNQYLWVPPKPGGQLRKHFVPKLHLAN
jgi:hypothetical protein